MASFSPNGGRTTIALQAARAAGRECPASLRIAGFCDGWPHEAEDLGLTCMHIPLAEMSFESTQILIDRLENDTTRPAAPGNPAHPENPQNNVVTCHD